MRIVTLSAALALAACAPVPVTTTDASSDSVVPDAVVDAGPSLPSNVFALAGLDPTLPTADLEPLGAMAQNADVVAFGETVHTSGGFYRAKSRAIRYLVRERGFRLVSFESPWRNAERVERYVQQCEGTAEDAARALHTIWWDRSVPELLRWMCQWNTEHPADRVHFSGFDIRQPWTDVPALRTYFTANAPDVSVRLVDGLARCFGAGFSDEEMFFRDATVRAIYEGRARVSVDDNAACTQGLAAVRDYLQRERVRLVSAAGEGEWELARLAAVSIEGFQLAAFEAVSRRSLTRGQSGRDAAMADAFTTLRRLRFAGMRAAVWTHNLHVTHHTEALVQTPYPNAITFGTLLQRALGARYVGVAVVGYNVGYNWFEGPATLEMPSEQSVETLLHGLGLAVAWVDLRAPGARPLLDAQALYDLGPEYLAPAAHYDGLLYVDAPEGATYFTPQSPFAR
ncbi:MAG: erythromycin esterase family protein [Myxococcales bacterium]|nr:erythromycin esterase family protein [Myxococcales bacterium]